MIAGIHASWYIGARLNKRWDSDPGFDWEGDAEKLSRRIMQHYLCWVGVAVGLVGLVAAFLEKQGVFG
jgi:hypothetical protein